MISVESLIERGVCHRYRANDHALLREILGGQPSWTPREFVERCREMGVHAEEQSWVLLHPSVISERGLHELACRFAEQAIRLSGQPAHPDSLKAIEAKRAWLRGEIGDEELRAAASAARAVSDAAAHSAAAYAAADAAAYAAADAAAYAAAYAAIRAAACAEQVEMILDYITTFEEAGAQRPR